VAEETTTKTIVIDLDKFDPEDLSLGAIEEFEDYTGSSIEELAGLVVAGSLSSRMLTGLAWLLGQVDDPHFTLADARKLKLRQIDTSKVPQLQVKRPPQNRAARRAKPKTKRG
jgi:hypothetical protein